MSNVSNGILTKGARFDVRVPYFQACPRAQLPILATSTGEFSSSGEYVLSALAAGNVATTLPRSKVIVVNAPVSVGT